MKRKIAALLAVAFVMTAMPLASVSAQSGYATRGEVVQILLEAADDYNPQVQKTDIIKGYGDGDLHEAVSYTHLDVYKRQLPPRCSWARKSGCSFRLLSRSGLMYVLHCRINPIR